MGHEPDCTAEVRKILDDIDEADRMLRHAVSKAHMLGDEEVIRLTIRAVESITMTRSRITAQVFKHGIVVD